MSWKMSDLPQRLQVMPTNNMDVMAQRALQALYRSLAPEGEVRPITINEEQGRYGISGDAQILDQVKTLLDRKIAPGVFRRDQADGSPSLEFSVTEVAPHMEKLQRLAEAGGKSWGGRMLSRLGLPGRHSSV
jgi:hypothetical protein